MFLGRFCCSRCSREQIYKSMNPENRRMGSRHKRTTKAQHLLPTQSWFFSFHISWERAGLYLHRPICRDSIWWVFLGKQFRIVKAIARRHLRNHSKVVVWSWVIQVKKLEMFSFDRPCHVLFYTLNSLCTCILNFSLPVSFILMYLFTAVYFSYFKLFVVFLFIFCFSKKIILKNTPIPKKKKRLNGRSFWEQIQDHFLI